jgi:predicted DNA-binding antitoxin AbrB/MazE fold protein
MGQWAFADGCCKIWDIMEPNDKYITAIFEDGIFRPLGPVDLPEGAIVRLDVIPADSLLEARLGGQLADYLKGRSPEEIDDLFADWELPPS